MKVKVVSEHYVKVVAMEKESIVFLGYGCDEGASQRDIDPLCRVKLPKYVPVKQWKYAGNLLLRSPARQ